jgi:hypothetical protein
MQDPGAYGKLGLSDLFEMREECLREFGFSDVYRLDKDKENNLALQVWGSNMGFRVLQLWGSWLRCIPPPTHPPTPPAASFLFVREFGFSDVYRLDMEKEDSLALQVPFHVGMLWFRASISRLWG